MRKTALFAAACAVVLSSVASVPVEALSAQNVRSEAFVQTTLLAKETNKPKQVAEKPAAPEQKASALSANEKKNNTEPAQKIVTVAEGESLSSIAATHNTTWVRLFNANTGVVNPDIINPGDQIRIPAADEQLTERPLPQPVIAVAPVAVQSNTQGYTTYTATPRPQPVAAAVYPTDPNAAKAFIYSKESGNNPNATNPTGCYGIGQDCNGVVRSQCGADYACQDAYFTGYATRRYGSWEAAQAFWLNNGWW